MAPSLTLNSPVRVPVAVGVNVTLTVHVPFAGNEVLHVVSETAKSPVVPRLMLPSTTDKLLVRVNVFAALVVPTACVE